VAYEPDREAAWDVAFGPFRLLQRAQVEAERDGAATRLRLTIETRASGPDAPRRAPAARPLSADDDAEPGGDPRAGDEDG
jgi:hypothetical protein